jgi:hypothetical protein
MVIAACAFVLRRTLKDKGGVVSSLRVSPGEQILISVREYNAPSAALESSNTPGDED